MLSVRPAERVEAGFALAGPRLRPRVQRKPPRASRLRHTVLFSAWAERLQLALGRELAGCWK